VAHPLDRGLYERLVTANLEARLTELRERLVVQCGDLHAAEAAERIALHLYSTIERAIGSISEADRSSQGVKVARALLERLDQLIERGEVAGDLPVEPASVLRAIVGRNPDGSDAAIEPPLVPLLDTTLLTNSPREPRVGRAIEAEIASADKIGVLMAFIRYSGVQPLKEALRRHLANGRPLRVLTTIYTGSTERRALDLLRDLGAEIRVSYDASTTRLHAKAWLFHRHSGFSTAYIGSSNLTYSAQVSGLEWNLRVSAARNRNVIEEVTATFDTYWESRDYVPYEGNEFETRSRQERATGPKIFLSPVEIRPTSFQEHLLEQIAVSRAHGHHRNLLAAATGTGKTVMAALDFARLRATLPRARLLFVAHRAEILDQSQATFRHALRDAAFGERWVQGDRPSRFENVFASIQSLQRIDLNDLPPDHFDVVIVDEFHHAAARSYDRILSHVAPRELLGLTATPERADGLPILHWFGDRIAAELRLWDAIDQQYLTPFLYFGIHDGLDLSEVPWRRGAGYDAEGLTRVYTASDAWARTVVHEFRERVSDPAKARALGFCVSVEHARYMARIFQECGIPATAVWGGNAEEDRKAALMDLRDGKCTALFSVDLFNEGLDVPSVDTLLLLRPTESPTLFLQQLGRGLRRSEGKVVCTVLDFVGHHRKEFRFDRRLRGLLGGTRKDVERQVEERFPYLPAGCHMELDPVASEIVLKSLRDSIPTRWDEKVGELRSLLALMPDVTLAEYLDHSGLDVEDVYGGSKSWSDLREAAGATVHSAGPSEQALRRAIGRLLHVDDDLRLLSNFELVNAASPPNVSGLREAERRLLRMLLAALLDQVAEKGATLQQGADLLWEHPQVLAELRSLFPLLRERCDHLTKPLEEFATVPLRVHARYSRVEILGALEARDRATVPSWQAGVRWLPEINTDVFAFTLDKTGGNFSPTTRYRDYAISPTLIHWESQSMVREESDTGRRYREHVERGNQVLLFARLRQSDRAFWFLGPARYVRHVGERPMAVIWELLHPLPGDLYSAFAAVAGA